MIVKDTQIIVNGRLVSAMKGIYMKPRGNLSLLTYRHDLHVQNLKLWVGGLQLWRCRRT